MMGRNALCPQVAYIVTGVRLMKKFTTLQEYGILMNDLNKVSRQIAGAGGRELWKMAVTSVSVKRHQNALGIFEELRNVV